MSSILTHGGLPLGIKRSQFIGRIKLALKARGLKTSAIRYLSDAFDKWTRDQDYEPGRICGFWHQVNGIAVELSCSERTVHSIESDLLDAGFIARHPKANGRRDGLRDSEGAKTLRKVFGINLAPIIEQAPELLAEAETIQLRQDALESCRSEIRQINRRIRQLNCPEARDEAIRILPNGRTKSINELQTLEEVREALLAVERTFVLEPPSEEFSDQSAEITEPIEQTKQSKSRSGQSAISELVTLQQAITLANEPFRECLEMYQDYTWHGFVNAAYQMARSIGVCDRTWSRACAQGALGPERAAICIILILRSLDLPSSHKNYPRSPAACLGGMINAAKEGTLNLPKTLAYIGRRSKFSGQGGMRHG